MFEKREYNFKTEAEFNAKYSQLVNLVNDSGSSGSWCDNVGTIHSLAEDIHNFLKQGYKRVGYSNGGDDDILVVDHLRKELATFEDNIPQILTKNSAYSKKSLQQFQDEEEGIGL